MPDRGRKSLDNAMKSTHLVVTVALLAVVASSAPAAAQTVGRIRRSLDRATGGQTAAPARPAPAPAAPARDPQAAAALRAAQDRRNQAAAVGADERVVEFLKTRVEGGSADAAFDLAKRYEEGKGVTADPKEARRHYELAAARGHEAAAAWLKEHPAPKVVAPSAAPAPKVQAGPPPVSDARKVPVPAKK